MTKARTRRKQSRNQGQRFLLLFLCHRNGDRVLVQDSGQDDLSLSLVPCACLCVRMCGVSVLFCHEDKVAACDADSTSTVAVMLWRFSLSLSLSFHDSAECIQRECVRERERVCLWASRSLHMDGLDKMRWRRIFSRVLSHSPPLSLSCSLSSRHV